MLPAVARHRGSLLVAAYRSTQWSAFKPPFPVRAIGTDGPFRHIKPKFVTRKKHYNKVLVMADRRKLLETAQEVLADRGKEFPLTFWEIFSKRCIRSMHLFNPLELAIVARAFDAHDICLEGLNVFDATAEALSRNHQDTPGLALVVLVEVIGRRLPKATAETHHLLQQLGRRAADVLSEISPHNALGIVGVLSAVGIRDQSLMARVAQKVHVQVDTLSISDLARAAESLAEHEHRDLELLRECAARWPDLDRGSPDDAASARVVLASLEHLQVRIGVSDLPFQL